MDEVMALTNRCNERPQYEIRSVCLPRHPAVAYLFLVTFNVAVYDPTCPIPWWIN